MENNDISIGTWDEEAMSAMRKNDLEVLKRNVE